MRYRVHREIDRAPVRELRWLLGACALVALSGCAHSKPPSPDRPAPAPPALNGLAVMVLPVQTGRAPAVEGLDAELEFWLADYAPGVRWIFPPALERSLSRSSMIEVPIHALAVSSFHYAQVERIGDPLFGDLRRAGAVVNARYALLPISGAYLPAESGPGRVELAVALIDTVGGGVLWYGVVAGDRGELQEPGTIATAARALATSLFPGGGHE